MRAAARKIILTALAVALGLILGGLALAQVGNPFGGYNQAPTTPQSPYPAVGGNTQQQPQQQPQYQQPYQQQPQQQQQVQPGQRFTDAMGQFRLNLPQGMTGTVATYNFAMPGANINLTLSATMNAQLFQATDQAMTGNLQQMGAQIKSEGAVTYANIQCRYIVASMTDRASGQQFDIHTVLMPGANLMLQAYCPAQSTSLAQDVMDAMLKSLELARR
ncbi:hypothetical protein Deba_0462 [Desulfarculus baarsii DSM 2075]|uniref:Uncharacterized protein n=1 Tax=Desulfarculus baarsii (strain ATCC 33931 / DSM 2075 / LMG 7858 / VKM B-1802 / 2st14) TaxID=644282 RepID=E1QE49_DESB2|nr:hypothetical protein [Desulfarculus baarsii]ADK83835.1 hypothetical protein Deba_0462 [Desulfarculus baarsii DSM 2075]